jgi:hypothetical protein
VELPAIVAASWRRAAIQSELSPTGGIAAARFCCAGSPAIWRAEKIKKGETQPVEIALGSRNEQIGGLPYWPFLDIVNCRHRTLCDCRTDYYGSSQVVPMQFRLRTLLIVLALGPPLLACAWWYLRPHHLGLPVLALMLVMIFCLAMFWRSLVKEA